ncbi:tyrosine-type recombinase/integrase [Enterococcus xiangfangensis]|uniref:tyrosine-type recombinase/integrase n=1 Tax=Enterococcus xiangfangensis TaxID=1296537 RepID=UPI003D162F5E|nr:site-specific integrase [Enterococcus asini]
MAKKEEKIIQGNKTTGIVKLETGKYKFKVRYGTNKSGISDYGLFDKQKTVKVTTDAEAKKFFKKYKEEMQNLYIEEKARYEEKQEIVATQYTADNADESLLSMTFKEFTFFEKGNQEEGLFFSNIPRTNGGDNYSINTLNTLRKNIAVINQDAYSFFNKKKLVEIDSEDAEELVEALRKKKWIVNKAEGLEKTMANSTLSNYVKSLKIIFKSLETTVKLRKKDSNPFMNVKVGTIKYKKDGKTSLDTVDEYDVVKEELKNMVSNEPDTALFFLFAMISMLRREEIAALEWSDLNYEDKTIKIKGVLEEDTYLNKIGYREYTKNGEIRLSIMNNELIEILKRIEPMEKKYWLDDKGNKHDFIFLKNDRLYKLDYWTNQWRTYFRPKLLEKGLIKNKTTLHDLRGSGISYYLIEKKMDVTVLARIVGHSDIAMTLNVYSHATDNNVKQFAMEIE